MAGPVEKRRAKERRERFKKFIGGVGKALPGAEGLITGKNYETTDEKAKRESREERERVVAQRQITKRVETSREARNLNTRDWSYFPTGEQQHRPLKAGDNIRVGLPDDATLEQFAEAMGRSGEIATIFGVIPAIDAETTDLYFDPEFIGPVQMRETTVVPVGPLESESYTKLYAYWNFIKSNPSFAGRLVKDVVQTSEFRTGIDAAIAYQQAIEQGESDLALQIAQDAPAWAQTTISMTSDPAAINRVITPTLPPRGELTDDVWNTWLSEATLAGVDEKFIDWLEKHRNGIEARFLESGQGEPLDYLDNNLDGFVDWFTREQPIETRGRDSVVDPLIDAMVRGLPVEIASEIRGELKRQLLLRQGESGEGDKTRVWTDVPQRLKDSLVNDAIAVNILGGHPQYEAIMEYLRVSGVSLSAALRGLATQRRQSLCESGEILEDLGPAVVDGMSASEILPLLLGQLEQFAPGILQIASTPTKTAKGTPQPADPTQAQLFGQYFNPWMRELGVPLHLRARMEQSFINTFFATDDPTQMSLQSVATRLGNTDIPAFMRQVATDYIEGIGGDDALSVLNSDYNGDPFKFFANTGMQGVLTDGEFARRLQTVLDERIAKQVKPQDTVLKLIQTNVFGKAFGSLPADLQKQLASVGTTAAEMFAVGEGVDLKDTLTMDPFGPNALGAIRNAIGIELRDLLSSTAEGRKLVQLARINEGGDIITFLGKHIGPLGGRSLDEMVKLLAKGAPKEVQPGESEDAAAARREIADAA